LFVWVFKQDFPIDTITSLGQLQYRRLNFMSKQSAGEHAHQ